jgi:DnaK suppressor protein
MSKLDLTIIREILMEEEIALAADMQNEEDKLQQQNEENPDLSDLADQRLHQEIVVSRLSLMNQRLTQVRAALKRLDEGKYGICASCGNDINPERLKVIPYTTLCVSCQERFELAKRANR